MYSVQPWCVLWKYKITPINFFPLNRSDSRCLHHGLSDIYIFRMILQFINLTRCGVPHHPIVAARTGDEYCLTMLHHLTLDQFTNIRNHLSKEFSGVLGTRNNDWSHATGPLGFLLVVFESGSGQAHGDVVPINAGIF